MHVTEKFAMFALRNEDSLHKTIDFKFQQKLFDLNAEKCRVEKQAIEDLSRRDKQELDTRKANPTEACVECLIGCGAMFAMSSKPQIYKSHVFHCRKTETDDILLLVIRFVSEFKGEAEFLEANLRSAVRLTDGQVSKAISYLVEKQWLDPKSKQFTEFGKQALKFII